MALMQAATGKSAWPEGSLPALLEQWLYVCDATPVSGWPLGGNERIRIVGIVKGPDTVGDTGADLDALIGTGHQRLLDGIARAMREQMYRDAESAIEAAQRAGWRLTGHPRISVDGQLNRDKDTGIWVPCTEMRVELTFAAEPSPAG